MAKYTIEDIEILRQKSGISYEEAVNLLEYHNGSLARALVDLERNGRLKSGQANSSATFHTLFNKLYRTRLLIRRGETSVLNLSILFLLLVLITAPHILIIGLIASLLLGYRISIHRNAAGFADGDLDDMIHNARSNFQQSVSGFAHQSEAEQPQNPRTESAPSGTRPVSVPFTESSAVDVRDDGDGYHEADIR